MTSHNRFLVVSAIGATLAASGAALLGGSYPAIAQGALKPLQALVVNTDARPVPVEVIGAGRTHLGVPVEDHVVLVKQPAAVTPCSEDGNEAGDEFRRMSRDGTIEPGPFVVPSGRSLVVTDFDAVLVRRTGGSFDLGGAVFAMILMPERFGGITAAQRTGGVTIADATTEAVVVSSTLGAGAVFGAGQQVCMRGVEAFDVGILDLEVDDAAVRGYLF
jgi:hypothetical protein